MSTRRSGSLSPPVASSLLPPVAGAPETTGKASVPVDRRQPSRRWADPPRLRRLSCRPGSARKHPERRWRAGPPPACAQACGPPATVRAATARALVSRRRAGSRCFTWVSSALHTHVSVPRVDGEGEAQRDTSRRTRIQAPGSGWEALFYLVPSGSLSSATGRSTRYFADFSESYPV